MGIYELKVSLAWIDPPAQVDQAIALMNDLDLSISAIDQDTSWFPWILDSSPNLAALQAPATTGIDRLNNQEQISIRAPKAGNYQIHIQSRDLTTIQQAFALTYQMDTLGHFKFTSPAKEEQLDAGPPQIIRWDYTGTESHGKLWYRMLSEEPWTLISDAVDLTQEWYLWDTPQTSGQVQLRMDTKSSQQFSDPFLISPIPDFVLTVNCNNDLLFEWNSIEGIESYQFYELVGEQMEPTVMVSDTFFQIKSPENKLTAYSIAPIINGSQTGQRSLAIQPRFQNPPCYIEQFTGTLLVSTSFIDIELSTLQNVKGIELQKFDGTSYQLLQTFTPDRLDFEYRDEQLEKGNNFYQLRIILENTNAVILSEINVFYVPLDDVILYPNPILSGELMEVVLPTFRGRRIQISDALGRLVLDYNFLSEFDVLETQNWAAGVYFYQIINEVGKREHQGKLIVR